MKKKILLVLAVLISVCATAQGPALEGTWYLHSYEYDLGDFIEIKNISPPINPTIVFEEDYSFTGLVCNEYGGNFEYNEVDDNFTLTFFDVCLCGTCNNPPQSHVDLESDYFDFFIPITHEYLLFTDPMTNEKVLQFEAAPGFILTYRDAPVVLSVSEVHLNNIILFPNPTSTYLNVSSQGQLLDTATIFSITGKQLQKFNSADKQLDISSLPKGIYFLEMTLGQVTSVQKFIKN